MYNFKDYVSNKDALLSRVEAIQGKIAELGEMGLDVTDTLKKLDNAKTIMQNDKISVVLVGAFSDGKTSVIAGWLNEKMDNMKIDSAESSDEILCYTPSSIPEGCQIVDTPGLFGEKKDGDNIVLSSKTKKYISEANLILYVVAAKNPIKESHKESIRWIMRDLNKLSSTIFVINRMDDVADVTDEEDFSRQANIKTENLHSKLADCGLTPEEIAQVPVVCISAAPGGKDIDVWKDYREEYLRRSHLAALENATNEILKTSREQILTKTGCDILNDEITKTLANLREESKKMERCLKEEKETVGRNRKDVDKLRAQLLNSRKEIKAELMALENRKVSAIRAASMDNFRDVVEAQIGLLPGQEGYLLSEEINMIFENHCMQQKEKINKTIQSIQKDCEKHNSVMERLLPDGLSSVSHGFKHLGNLGTDVLKSGVFKSRDLLGKVGLKIKFKPWQATKIANFASKSLPIIGIGIQLVADYKANKKAEDQANEFAKAKNDLITEIITTLKGLRDQLDDDATYFEVYAPYYLELVDNVEKMEQTLVEQEHLRANFRAWEKSVSDADFAFC